MSNLFERCAIAVAVLLFNITETGLINQIVFPDLHQNVLTFIVLSVCNTQLTLRLLQSSGLYKKESTDHE